MVVAQLINSYKEELCLFKAMVLLDAIWCCMMAMETDLDKEQ